MIKTCRVYIKLIRASHLGVGPVVSIPYLHTFPHGHVVWMSG